MLYWKRGRYEIYMYFKAYVRCSEFLYDEKEEYFWKFVALVNEKGYDMDAKVEARRILPDSSMLDLVLNTRAYAAKIEMYRQVKLCVFI